MGISNTSRPLAIADKRPKMRIRPFIALILLHRHCHLPTIHYPLSTTHCPLPTIPLLP